MANSDIGITLRARDQASRVLDRVGGKLGMLRSQGLAVGAGFAVVNASMMAASRAVSELQQYIMDGVSSYRAFEDAISEVNTMLEGQSEQYLPSMRDAVENLSVEFGKSATDMAGGLYQVLSASVDASDAIDVLRTATIAATGGLTSVETSVDAITTVLNAYGMSAKEASHISDVMFKTVKRGKIRYDELADSLGYVVSVAAQANISFEQVAGAIATMTKQGIRANMAARSLRMIITDLMSPTTEAKESAALYGATLDGLHLSVVGLDGIVEELNETLGNNKTAWADIFPNVRSLSGVLALASNNAELFKDDIQSMFDESAGSASDAALEIVESGGFMAKATEQVMEKQKRDMGSAWDDIVLNAQRTGMSLVHAFEGMASGLSLTKILWGDKEGATQAINDFYKANDAFHELWSTGDQVKNTMNELRREWKEAQQSASDNRSEIEKNTDAYIKYLQASQILDNIDLFNDAEVSNAFSDFNKYKESVESVQGSFDSLTTSINEYEAQKILLLNGIKDTNNEINSLNDEITKLNESYRITQNITNAAYAIKDFGINTEFTDKSIERIVTRIVSYKRQLNQLNEAQWQYNMQSKKLSLERLRIEANAAQHRGRYTREQKDQLQRIEQQELELRIKQQENSIKTEQVQHNQLEKAKQAYDSWLAKQQWTLNELQDNHDEELNSLQKTLKMMKQQRDTYQKDLEETVIPNLKKSWTKYYNWLQRLSQIYSMAGMNVPQDVKISLNRARINSLVNQVLSKAIGGSYASGTEYVPETRPYLLHRGEAVIPRHENTGNNNSSKEVKVKVDFSADINMVDGRGDDLTVFSQKASQALRAGLIDGFSTVYD